MRPKENESTLCKYTVCWNEIKEGDILGYGDNYPCVVFYNTFEAKFECLEFGYKEEGYLYRCHDLDSYIVPWKILGNLKKNKKLLNSYPNNFNYNKDISKYFKHHSK